MYYIIMYTAWAMDQVKTLTSDDRGGGDNGKYVPWPTYLRMRASAVTSVGGIQKLRSACRRAAERTIRAPYRRRRRGCRLPLSPVQCCRSRRSVRPRVLSVAVTSRFTFVRPFRVACDAYIFFIHFWNCVCFLKIIVFKFKIFFTYCAARVPYFF